MFFHSLVHTLDSPDTESPFVNHRVGFVGKLGGMNRREARKLVRENGGIMVDPIDDSVDLIVVGADQLPPDNFEALLSPDLFDSVSQGRVTVLNETEVWERLGLVESDDQAKRLHTPAMLAQLLDVSIATIRRWHRRGLISPIREVKKLPYFDFQEVVSAQRISRLISSGAAPEKIEEKLTRLTKLFPGLDRPLAQLSVIVEGKDVLLRDGHGLLEPGGQKRFDFDGEQQPATTSDQVFSIEEFDSAATSADLQTPEQFLELAIEYEDAEDLDSAIEVYRALHLAFGPSADSCFRIAELLYQTQDVTAARERYYMAVEMDCTFVEARASLGCVLVELGQLELAHSAFAGALEHHEEYPDVRYHMARLLDDMGQAQEAELHWQEFLKLAPQSPWSDEARSRLGTRIDSIKRAASQTRLSPLERVPDLSSAIASLYRLRKPRVSIGLERMDNRIGLIQ